jgi:hypothetical protein
MNDIRQDLRERIDVYDSEIAELNDAIKTLESEAKHARELLAIEERRWARVTGPLFEKSEPEPQGQLSGVVLDVLSKQDSMELSHIKEAVVGRGYPFGEKDPGRSLHFALVGLSKQGLVQKVDGRWFSVPQNGGPG